MIKAGVECKSKDTNLGNFKNYKECAAAVVAKKGAFFVFGTGSKAGKCYMEKTRSLSCIEGFERDSYNFYSTGAASYLVKAGHECTSKYARVGKLFNNYRECAAAVVKKGGSYFTFGTGRRAGKCYMFYTKTAACKEGFKRYKEYSFYAVGTKASCTSKCYAWDESKTGNRCKSSCDCDGARRCSGAGWCSGTSGSKSSCAGYVAPRKAAVISKASIKTANVSARVEAKEDEKEMKCSDMKGPETCDEPMANG